MWVEWSLEAGEGWGEVKLTWSLFLVMTPEGGGGTIGGSDLSSSDEDELDKVSLMSLKSMSVSSSPEEGDLCEVGRGEDWRRQHRQYCVCVGEWWSNRCCRGEDWRWRAEGTLEVL